MSNYDLFLFPTSGENYGHVIAESITVGTRVLISNKTPWVNLESLSFGWNFDLNDINFFVEKIEEISSTPVDHRLLIRSHVIKNAANYLSDKAIINENIHVLSR